MADISYNELEQKIIKIINDMIDSRVSFTSKEITEAIRKDVGPTVNIPHNEVRNIMKHLYKTNNMRDYVRTLIRFGFQGQQVETFLYHYPDCDVDEMTAFLDDGSTKPQQIIQQPQPSQQQTQSNTQDNVIASNVDMLKSFINFNQS